MFKLVLSAAVILSCGLMGIMKAYSYKLRLKCLRNMKSMLKAIETEMKYRKDPLERIFFGLSSGDSTPASALLISCCCKLKEKKLFSSAWTEAIEETCQNSHLKPEDLEILTSLGTQLGKSGLVGQASVISLTADRLTEQIENAKEENATKGKMYRGLGFSLGIVLVIIMF